MNSPPTVQAIVEQELSRAKKENEILRAELARLRLEVIRLGSDKSMLEHRLTQRQTEEANKVRIELGAKIVALEEQVKRLTSSTASAADADSFIYPIEPV